MFSHILMSFAISNFLVKNFSETNSPRRMFGYLTFWEQHLIFSVMQVWRQLSRVKKIVNNGGPHFLLPLLWLCLDKEQDTCSILSTKIFPILPITIIFFWTLVITKVKYNAKSYSAIDGIFHPSLATSSVLSFAQTVVGSSLEVPDSHWYDTKKCIIPSKVNNGFRKYLGSGICLVLEKHILWKSLVQYLFFFFLVYLYRNYHKCLCIFSPEFDFPEVLYKQQHQNII